MGKYRNLLLCVLISTIDLYNPPAKAELNSKWMAIYQDDRGTRYRRNFLRQDRILSFEELENLRSPAVANNRLYKSMIYYYIVKCPPTFNAEKYIKCVLDGDCEEGAPDETYYKVTAMEFFAKQMATGESWAGGGSKKFPLGKSQIELCNTE